MRRYWLLLVNVAALALTACGTQTCGPSNCVGGCCDAMGMCISPTDMACGMPGTQCAACSAGQTCVLGACTAVAAPRCQASPVICQDQSIMQLRLFDTPNADGITEMGSAPNFLSLVDARAGGSAPTRAFVYMTFGTAGLEHKSLSDEAAFTSLDWDIALRRYVLRLNSGVSGPSCVEAARTQPGTSFDTLTQTPSGLSWRTEVYFTDPACDFVADTSGIGAPGTALSSFWTYQMCVQMTGNVYVLHLRDGRYVKLQVLSYYNLGTTQATCDSTGNVPLPNEAGLVKLKWAFIGAPP